MVRIEIEGAMASDLGAAVEDLTERDFYALALAVQDEQDRRRECYEAWNGEVYSWAAWRARDDLARCREAQLQHRVPADEIRGLPDAELAISRDNREWAERRILESLGLASGEAGR